MHDSDEEAAFWARVAAELEGHNESTSGVLEEAAAIAQMVLATRKRDEPIEGLVSTFRGCRSAAHLRLVPTRKLVEVAIVRIMLDEVDDAVFQCSAQALDHLIEALQSTRRDLDALRSASVNVQASIAQYSKFGGNADG